MNWIKNIVSYWRERTEERYRKQVVERANELIDVAVYDGSLWFVYDGNLVMPCIYVEGADDTAGVISVVMLLRKSYIERNL